MRGRPQDEQKLAVWEMGCPQFGQNDNSFVFRQPNSRLGRISHSSRRKDKLEYSKLVFSIASLPRESVMSQSTKSAKRARLSSNKKERIGAAAGGFLISIVFFVLVSWIWLVNLPEAITIDRRISTLMALAVIILVIAFVTVFHAGWKESNLAMMALGGFFAFYWVALIGMQIMGITGFMRYVFPNELIAAWLMTGIFIVGYGLLVASGAIPAPKRLARTLPVFLVSWLVATVAIGVATRVFPVISAPDVFVYLASFVVAIIVTAFIGSARRSH